LNITIGEDFQGDFLESFLTPKDEAKFKFKGIPNKLGMVLFFRTLPSSTVNLTLCSGIANL